MARTSLTVNLNDILGISEPDCDVSVKLLSEKELAFLQLDSKTTVPIYTWNGTTDSNGSVVFSGVPATADYISADYSNNGKYVCTIVVPKMNGNASKTYRYEFIKSDRNSTLRQEITEGV